MGSYINNTEADTKDARYGSKGNKREREYMVSLGFSWFDLTRNDIFCSQNIKTMNLNGNYTNYTRGVEIQEHKLFHIFTALIERWPL